MNRRLVVETAAKRLFEQGSYALGMNGNCRYRSQSEVGGKCLKCAIGLLIPDEMYQPEFEGKPIHQLIAVHDRLRTHLQIEYGKFETGDIGFLQHVQYTLHDYRASRNLPILHPDDAVKLLGVDAAPYDWGYGK